jgi:HD superfamily phosphohydrolase
MHKTVLAAEKLLVKIFERAKELFMSGNAPESEPSVAFFLENSITEADLMTFGESSALIASNFLSLDDNEMIASIRKWSESSDPVLSDLSKRLLFRNFLAIELSKKPFDEKVIEDLRARAKRIMKIGDDISGYYVYTGSVSNMTYAPSAPRVRIMDKSGITREITEVSDMLDHKALSKEVRKFFICYPKEIRE